MSELRGQIKICQVELLTIFGKYYLCLTEAAAYKRVLKYCVYYKLVGYLLCGLGDMISKTLLTNCDVLRNCLELLWSSQI